MYLNVHDQGCTFCIVDEILNGMSFSFLALGLICEWHTEVVVVCRTGSVIDLEAEHTI